MRIDFCTKFVLTVIALCLMWLSIGGTATSPVAPAQAQECGIGANPTPEQLARRKDALRATRTVNNLEANQPGRARNTYLRQAELPTSPFAAQQSAPSAEFFKKLNFAPGEELMPGWELRLDVTADGGYWFMIKDKTDPCGFAYVSNQTGVIFEAQPIR
jgi:hypothetical protein